MNDRDVCPNDRTFCALIRGFSFVHHKSRAWRAERMYFWLCKMRVSRLQPNMHTAKPFFKLGLYFPSVDGPFWRDFGVPFDICRSSFRNTRHSHQSSRRHHPSYIESSCLLDMHIPILLLSAADSTVPFWLTAIYRRFGPHAVSC